MKRRRRILGLILLAAGWLTACTAADAPDAPRLEIVDAWAHTAVMADAAGTTSAAYLTIRNTGRQPDRLIGASSNFAEFVEIHTTEERDGVMMMVPVAAVDIPARGEAVFKPGGLHIMFVNIAHGLTAGDKIDLTLRFEKSGPVAVEIAARDP